MDAGTHHWPCQLAIFKLVRLRVWWVHGHGACQPIPNQKLQLDHRQPGACGPCQAVHVEDINQNSRVLLLVCEFGSCPADNATLAIDLQQGERNTFEPSWNAAVLQLSRWAPPSMISGRVLQSLSGLCLCKKTTTAPWCERCAPNICSMSSMHLEESGRGSSSPYSWPGCWFKLWRRNHRNQVPALAYRCQALHWARTEPRMAR